jgi:hypothetical protein
MDKKRWLIRYLMITGVGIVMVIKIYLLLFVVDFTVGIYSFLTSLILFNIFFISFTRYKNPYIKAQDIVIPKDGCISASIPLVSMIVPVKNEEGISKTVCIMS